MPHSHHRRFIISRSVNEPRHHANHRHIIKRFTFQRLPVFSKKCFTRYQCKMVTTRIVDKRILAWLRPPGLIDHRIASRCLMTRQLASIAHIDATDSRVSTKSLAGDGKPLMMTSLRFVLYTHAVVFNREETNVLRPIN